MSGFKATKDQIKATSSRGKSVLVSAAAGSGKTTILVDRIIQKVLDVDNPIDIDSFLVVTFTKAAAANMKDKIIKAIAKRLESDPLNEHLAKQLALVNHAEIETIDSFCLRVVKENVSFLDFDSNFSIGNDDAVKIIAEDVINELFEEKFEAKDADFRFLMDIFSKKGTTEKLKELVFDINAKASAFPDPVSWLNDALASFAIDADTKVDDIPIVKAYFERSCKMAEASLRMVDAVIETMANEYGAIVKPSVVDSDKELLEGLANSNNYSELYKLVSASKFKTLSYDEKPAEEFKKLSTSLRDSYKGIASSENKKKFASPEEILENITNTSKYLRPLVELSLEFYKRFSDAKKEELIFTFTDIERFAYELLADGIDNGRVVPSKIARSMAKRYEEIYIDEYQDSNYLQEYILSSVSGAGRAVSNMFMVGDVKQSIYRFRKARPDLFIGKYKSFLPIENDEPGEEQRILLSENFRSRKEVLDGINYIFGQIMGEDFGEIPYDEDAKLNAGKTFPIPEASDNIDPRTEVIYIDSSADEAVDDKKLEARAIANRILEYTDAENGLSVFDEELGKYRRAEFRDIKILLRTPAYLSSEISDEFNARGIPVYLENGEGYFETTEISTILSFVSVIDNAYQDIPFFASLVSPIGNVSENELVLVCKYFDGYAEKQVKNRDKDVSETELIKQTKKMIRNTSLYEKCKVYVAENEDALSGKLNLFLNRIKDYKIKKQYTSVADLLRGIYEDTGYYLYASAMPLGDRRRANLDGLVKRAADYESGSFKGLFDYVRYIEKYREAGSDFGEASTISEDSNVVQVMSMHKSKGLEFPICIVAGLGKQHNLKDAEGNVIADDDYYIVGKMADYDKKFFGKGFLKEALSVKLQNATKAEELRNLYVAFTRAKEKLVLTGKINRSAIDDKYKYLDNYCETLLPGNARVSIVNPIEFVYLALKRKHVSVFGCTSDNLFVDTSDKDTLAAVNDVIVKKTVADEFQSILSEVNAENDNKKDVCDYFFKYPAETLTRVESKLSVSALKHEAAAEKGIVLEGDYDASEAMSISEEEYEIKQAENIANRFKERDQKRKAKMVEASDEQSGTEYGSLMHKYCEMIPFAELDYSDENFDWNKYAIELRDDLVLRGVMSEEEGKALSIKALSAFLKSDLCKRMSSAAKDNKLHIEEKFYIGLDPLETRAKLFDDFEISRYQELVEDEDLIVVQGIIDAYFYEGDEIVLMDYKTDVVPESEIKDRYQKQIELYKESLERVKNIKVKECILYAFRHQKEIVV